MISYFCNKRNIYVCFVDKAVKDNSVCKKGESYIWVKSSKYALKEFFKTEKDLNKKYPEIISVSINDICKLLNKFKKSEEKDSYNFVKKYIK